jgi:hypothetical protein
MATALGNRRFTIANGSRLLAIGSAVVLLGTLFVVSQGWITPWAMSRFAAVLTVVLEEGLVVMAWLVAAVGYGWAVRSTLSRRPLNIGVVEQWVIGAAVLMLIDASLGCLGLLSRTTVWVISVIGWGLASRQVYAAQESWKSRSWPSVSWHVVLAAPALGLLLGAATIAPGVLWGSEFGGYDVLEYHLELPREWLAAGRITGLPYNVYSYMPNLFEAAFMHLSLWSGGAVGAAYAAQLLHAAFALFTALTIARIIGRCCGTGGALAGTLYLATPWTIVTGSMAYNEQAMMAMSAAAMSLIIGGDDERGPSGTSLGVRTALVAGFLAGVAVLIKPSAIGLVAVPLLLIVPWRSKLPFALACGAVVSLWLIRNAIWIGSPLFPMFGQAHWTAEQVERFGRAHGSPGILHGFTALWDQFITHPQFAYLLVPAAIVGGVLAMRRDELKQPARAAITVLAFQLLFWLLLTHHQSRFLIPLLLPLTLLIGLGVASIPRREHAASLALAAVAMWCTAVSLSIYLLERDGQAGYFVDGISVLKDLDPQNQVDTPYTVINGTLPPTARIYAEGFATPLYIERPIAYHTVWDASPLGAALAEGGVSGAHRWLKQRGFTHVLIDWGMIDLWLSPGNYGYDANVKPDRLKALADAVLEPVHGWPGGAALYIIK